MDRKNNKTQKKKYRKMLGNVTCVMSGNDSTNKRNQL